MRATRPFRSKTTLNLAALLTVALSLWACSGRRSATIEHTVIILQENHTFDNYFGAFPGADGAMSGSTSTGATVPLAPLPDMDFATLCNSWDCALQAMDGGRMDGFDLINGGLSAYAQASSQEIPLYWRYAQHFALADRYFTSVHGPSLPNHLFTLAAQSGGTIDNVSAGSGGVGCDGSPTGTVTVIDASGNRTEQSPCFDFVTMPDLLEAAGISWKYYIEGGKGVLAVIRHIRNSPMWTQNQGTTTQFLQDAQSGQLPAVTWLITPYPGSEHPPNSICAGDNQTAQFINAIMQGPAWNSTAIFVTYDDFGGYYDHVPPPQLDQEGLGPRVPLLIISPFAKRGYISHMLYEHSSMLKFIETRYLLRSLTARDAGANNLLDSFNFTQPPQPPLILQPHQCP
jgi:phospholipase C